MLRVTCPTCKKALNFDDATAGTLATCPGCRTAFLVPRNTAPGTETFTATRKESSAPRPPATEPPMGMPRLALDEDEPPRATPPRPPDEDAASTYAVELELAEPDRPRPTRRRPRRPRSSRDRPWKYTWGYGGDLLPGISNLMLILMVLGLGLLLLAGLTLLVRPAFILMIAAGFLILIVADVWLTILAFQDSVGTGLLYLIVPFYRILFLATNLEQTGPPLLVQVIGIVYIVAGFVLAAATGKA
jgi:hypothetical protein